MILWTLCTFGLYTKRNKLGNTALLAWLGISFLLFLTNNPAIPD